MELVFSMELPLLVAAPGIPVSSPINDSGTLASPRRQSVSEIGLCIQIDRPEKEREIDDIRAWFGLS